jgi:hypothetical protein
VPNGIALNLSNGRPENVRVVAVIIAKLELGNIVRHVFLADLVEASTMPMLGLATGAWLARAREKRNSSCRFVVHSENPGYVYFLCCPRRRSVRFVSF